MKRLNFNIKDRKVLTLGLCLVAVCVFTLTIAYAALNAVLTISGSAQVSSADWDIHLANPNVTTGSATTTTPTIKTSRTMEFSTTLNMPGDFYEFTVDVVNSGSIDAMIENVIKNPELDASQKKYLNYEVTYQNGESITTKQTLSKGTTMPIKVRIEYRKDLIASDLPTGQVVLDLSLTLEYIQSDGTGTSVLNNGKIKPVASGSLDTIGTIITIDDQQFYIFGTEENRIKLLAKYNLYLGQMCTASNSCTALNPTTGLQDSTMIGYPSDGGYPRYGTVGFGTTNYKGSKIEEYVNNYKTYIEKLGIPVIEARIMTKEELESNEIKCDVVNNTCTTSPYSWIYSTSYWTQTMYNSIGMWSVETNGRFGFSQYSFAGSLGVRPVIVISKDNF